MAEKRDYKKGKTNYKRVNPVNMYQLGGQPNPYAQLGGMAGGILGGAVQSSGSSAGVIGGSALSGAASGAAAGSIVPGVGTAIGAGVGALTGVIKGIGKNKQNKEAAKAARLQERMIKEQQLTSMPTSQGGVTPGVVNPYIMAFGGLFNPTLNQEQAVQQQMVDRKQGLMNMLPGALAYGGMAGSNNLETYENGGLHSQNPLGGIPIGMGQNGQMNTVEEGESSYKFNDGRYVFTNRLNVAENDLGLPTSINGKTFADASKHIESLFKGRNSSTDISTKTALMKRLRESQEILKQTSEAPVPNKMAYGGGINKYDGTQPYSSLLTQAASGTLKNPLESAMGRMTSENIQIPTSNITNTTLAQNRINAVNPSMGLNTTGTENGGQDNWLQKNKNTLISGVGLASMAVPLIANRNAMKNLQRPEEIQASKLSGEITPQSVNRQQIERNLTNQLATQRQALSERSGGDFGQYAANLQSLHSGSANALANATLQANLADAQERARAEQANLGIDQFNIQQEGRASEMNAQNQAAYEAQKAAYQQANVANITNIGKSMFNYGQAQDYAGSMSNVMSLLGLSKKK